MKNTKRPLIIAQSNVNFLMAILLLFPQVTRPQIKTGSVFFANFTPNEFTIAADSRMTIGEMGIHDDTECKISAFGKKFVFAMVGAVFPSEDKRDPHLIARQIWETESLSEHNAAQLTYVVADSWAIKMGKIYEESGQIGKVRKHTGGQTLANAIFGATDSTRQISVVTVNINFDGNLFDQSKQIHITHDTNRIPVNSFVSGGLDEIADEFSGLTSKRAIDYMAKFRVEISALPPAKQQAKLVAEYVYLSIRLHPRKEELGMPVDVLQLKTAKGITWVAIKPNCPQN